MKARTIALFGLLTAITLVLGYLDRMIPIPLPGVRLGLSNTVVLYALYLMDKRSALLLMLLKVILQALLFGFSIMTFMVSLGGGVLSLVVMILIISIKKADIIVVSIFGALAHIIGQILVVVLAQMVPSAFVIGYLPLLGIAALITGALTGIVGKYTFRALGAYSSGKK